MAQENNEAPGQLSEAQKNQKMEDNAVNVSLILNTKNKINTPGIHLESFTAENFASLPRGLASKGGFDDGFVAMLQMAAAERYDLLDSLKPTKMSREEFVHVLLLEGKKRGVLHYVVDNLVPQNKPVTVTRPLGVPASQQVTAQVDALDITWRDNVTNMLLNPSYDKVVVAPDVAQQVGFPKGQTRYFQSRNDMETLIIAYMAGSNSDFSANGKLPLQIGFPKEVSSAQIQDAFCSSVKAISKPGRAVDNGTAATVGLLLARSDAKTNFQNTSPGIGVLDGTCSVTPPAWTPNRRVALAAFERAPIAK